LPFIAALIAASTFPLLQAGGGVAAVPATELLSVFWLAGAHATPSRIAPNKVIASNARIISLFI
jgi:hypothetical protein